MSRNARAMPMHAMASRGAARCIMTDARKRYRPPSGTPPGSDRRRIGPRTLSLGARPLGLTPALAARFQALHEENARLRALALTDDLTGAYNRRYFASRLRRALQAGTRAEGVALCLFDLDDFKRINDQHGHHAGDRLLRLVARSVQRRLRRAEDSLCRLGGDEFAAICSAASPNDAMEQARQMMQAVRALGQIGAAHGLPAVTAAFGVIWLAPDVTPGWREAYAAADRALYRAKLAGKNDVVLADWREH
ncbi:GGDEF domain-containing protein [Bordetella genomosp. 1]|nr:GGDEF domain-containing protein [Bordetella genomosp. 1]